uniref:Histone-lysine N-methyltransferase n=1 Tax=Rhabditophanes sp. KR3021 TaxID=114890 RepID=A0AC35U9E1_9BILA
MDHDIDESSSDSPGSSFPTTPDLNLPIRRSERALQRRNIIKSAADKTCHRCHDVVSQKDAAHFCASCQSSVHFDCDLTVDPFLEKAQIYKCKRCKETSQEPTTTQRPSFTIGSSETEPPSAPSPSISRPSTSYKPLGNSAQMMLGDTFDSDIFSTNSSPTNDNLSVESTSFRNSPVVFTRDTLSNGSTDNEDIMRPVRLSNLPHRTRGGGVKRGGPGSRGKRGRGRGGGAVGALIPVIIEEEVMTSVTPPVRATRARGIKSDGASSGKGVKATRGRKPKAVVSFSQSNSTTNLQAILGGSERGASSISKLSTTSSRSPEDTEYNRTIIVANADDKYLLTIPICLICGSAGKGVEGSMIRCCTCAQSYHTYCVNMHTKLSSALESKGWRCLDCSVCEGCGKGSDEPNLLLCDGCDVSFHIYCMDPPLSKIPSASYRCKDCARCCRCSKIVPSNYDLSKMDSLCEVCYSLRKCPKCTLLYDENDAIIKCHRCMRWLHGKCEDLLTDIHLEAASENFFNCSLCVPKIKDETNFPVIVDNVMMNRIGTEKFCSTGNPILQQQLNYNATKDSIYRSSSAMSNTEGASVNGNGVGDQVLGNEDGSNLMMDDCDNLSIQNWAGNRNLGTVGPATKAMLRTQYCSSNSKRGAKLGVGGFVVRNPRKTNFTSIDRGDEEEPTGSSIPVTPSDFGDGSKPKQRKTRRSRKPAMEENYPIAIQAAFFGNDGVDSKGIIDCEVEEPELEETFRPDIEEMSANKCFMLGKETSSQLRQAERDDRDIKDLLDFQLPDNQGEDLDFVSFFEELDYDDPVLDDEDNAMEPQVVLSDQDAENLLPNVPAAIALGHLSIKQKMMASEGKRQQNRGNNSMKDWEEDEPLGEKATKAAVLYSNLHFPELRKHHPNWSDRAKLIHRNWRALSAEDRNQFVGMARDNRSKQVKQAKLNNSAGQAPPNKGFKVPPTPGTNDSLEGTFKSEYDSAQPSFLSCDNGTNGASKGFVNIINPILQTLPPDLAKDYDIMTKKRQNNQAQLCELEGEIAKIKRNKKNLGAKIRAQTKTAKEIDENVNVDTIAENEKRQLEGLNGTLSSKQGELDILKKESKAVEANISKFEKKNSIDKMVAQENGSLVGECSQFARLDDNPSPEEEPTVTKRIRKRKKAFPYQRSRTLGGISFDALSSDLERDVFCKLDELVHEIDIKERAPEYETIEELIKVKRKRAPNKATTVKTPVVESGKLAEGDQIIATIQNELKHLPLISRMAREPEQVITTELYKKFRCIDIPRKEEFYVARCEYGKVSIKFMVDSIDVMTKPLTQIFKPLSTNGQLKLKDIYNNVAFEDIVRKKSIKFTSINQKPALGVLLGKSRKVYETYPPASSAVQENNHLRTGYPGFKGVSCDGSDDFFYNHTPVPRVVEIKIEMEQNELDDAEAAMNDLKNILKVHNEHHFKFEIKEMNGKKDMVRQVSTKRNLDNEQNHIAPKKRCLGEGNQRYPQPTQLPSNASFGECIVGCNYCDKPFPRYTTESNLIEVGLRYAFRNDNNYCGYNCYVLDVINKNIPLKPDHLNILHPIIEKPKYEKLSEICTAHFVKNLGNPDFLSSVNSTPNKVEVDYMAREVVVRPDLKDCLSISTSNVGSTSTAQVTPNPYFNMNQDSMSAFRTPREKVIRMCDLPIFGHPFSANSKSVDFKWKGEVWKIVSKELLESFSCPSLEIKGKLGQMGKQYCVGEVQDDIEDNRYCGFCFYKGDGKQEKLGRLINVFPSVWVHVNCALWSSGVYESPNGCLKNVEDALDRAQSVKCSCCNGVGASMKCYKLECGSCYHLPCAISRNGSFAKDKLFYCRSHTDIKEDLLVDNLECLRKIYIEKDENYWLTTSCQQRWHDMNLVLRVGSLIFHNAGELHHGNFKNCYTKDYIYPIGYKVSRFFWNDKNSSVCELYDFEIIEKDKTPIFKVTRVSDQQRWESSNCTEVFIDIMAKIQRMRDSTSTNLLKLFGSSLKGESLFGLSEPSIIKIVESLPGVGQILAYVFKYGEKELLEMPLAENKAGCARCENITNYKKPIKTSNTMNIAVPTTPKKKIYGDSKRNCARNRLTILFPQATDKQLKEWKASGFTEDMLSEGKNKFDPGNTNTYTQFRKMDNEWKDMVYLSKSMIAGLGLFAKRKIDMHCMIIEYKGEVIRSEVGNVRERQYIAAGKGIYMFRADDDTINDATLVGGLARYINHSCDPNCFTKVYEFNGEKKIVILACRPIRPGEELTYDYQFELEDCEDKIPCMCGCPNCIKFMN